MKKSQEDREEYSKEYSKEEYKILIVDKVDRVDKFVDKLEEFKRILEESTKRQTRIGRWGIGRGLRDIK